MTHQFNSYSSSMTHFALKTTHPFKEQIKNTAFNLNIKKYIFNNLTMVDYFEINLKLDFFHAA